MNDNDSPSLFGGYFNLHPTDAYLQVQQCTTFLSSFTEAFKERIEAEIEYSKSLLKTSKLLQHFVTPADPSPISYIASAFQVQHEERARHALQLAEYLHSEVEVPCTRQLRDAECELRLVQKELKGFYKQGEAVQEAYQKHLKRYYRTRQDWQQRMINKNVLAYTPGTTPSQKQKAASRLEQERKQNEQHRLKYIHALEAFNSFANRYNTAISPILKTLEKIEVDGLALQADSLRKLIVSEINMFKNIEYDLLNISRQMESVTPSSQIQDFVVANKDIFQEPIISIYAQGPIASRYQAIDLKTPICGTLLEESLIRIDSGVFNWLLDNKTNSTLRYAIQQLMLKQEGGEIANEEVEGQFLNQLEVTIKSNKSVKQLGTDSQPGQLLRIDQVYLSCLELVNAIAQLLKEDQKERRDSILQLIQSYLSTHHFYRFVTYAALNAYQEQHDQRVTGDTFPLLLKILQQRSLAVKDIFICRLILNLLFSVAYLADRPLYCFQFQPIRNLQCWQNQDFWQAVIFQSSLEASTLLPPIQRSYLKDVYLMRQKNVVFSALATYCHYMVMMGEDVGEVKIIVAKFADIFNLTEEHQIDLGKTIFAAMKQSKELDGQ